MTRTVTVIVHEGEGGDHSCFDVLDQDGNIADNLGWDEMLGALCELTHPELRKRPARYMKSPETFDAWCERYRWPRKQPPALLLSAPQGVPENFDK